MDTREKIRAAAAVPEVPLWSALVAGLAMAGGRIVPEDLWDAIGAWTVELEWDVRECAETAGFRFFENHQRSKPHEIWQEDFVRELREQNPGKNVWLVPLDELVCLSEGDEEAAEMISVQRLAFIGSEGELRQAIRKLIETDWDDDEDDP